MNRKYCPLPYPLASRHACDAIVSSGFLTLGILWLTPTQILQPASRQMQPECQDPSPGATEASAQELPASARSQ